MVGAVPPADHPAVATSNIERVQPEQERPSTPVPPQQEVVKQEKQTQVQPETSTLTNTLAGAATRAVVSTALQTALDSTNTTSNVLGFFSSILG